MPAPQRAGPPRRLQPSRYVRSTGTIDVRDQRTWTIALPGQGIPVGSWVEPGPRDTQIRPPEITNTTFSASGTSFAFITPDITAGVLLVAVFAYNTPSSTDVANTLPAGWIEAPPGTGGQFDSGATLGSAHLVVATKTSVGGVENHTWTTASSVSSAVISVLAYPGADLVDPWDQTAYSDETVNTTTHTTATITPAESSTWVVAAWMARNNAAFSSDVTVGSPDLTHRVLNLASNGGVEGTSGVRLLVADSNDAEVLTGAGISWTATEPSTTSVLPDFVGTLRPASGVVAAPNAPGRPVGMSATGLLGRGGVAVLLRPTAAPVVAEPAPRRLGVTVAALGLFAAPAELWRAPEPATVADEPAERPVVAVVGMLACSPGAAILRRSPEPAPTHPGSGVLLDPIRAVGRAETINVVVRRSIADPVPAEDHLSSPVIVATTGRGETISARVTRSVADPVLGDDRPARPMIAAVARRDESMARSSVIRRAVEQVIVLGRMAVTRTLTGALSAPTPVAPVMRSTADPGVSPEVIPSPLVLRLAGRPPLVGQPRTGRSAADPVAPLDVLARIVTAPAIGLAAVAAVELLRSPEAIDAPAVLPHDVMVVGLPRQPIPGSAPILRRSTETLDVLRWGLLRAFVAATSARAVPGPVLRRGAADQPTAPPRPITLAVLAGRVVAVAHWQARAAFDPVAASATIGQITSGSNIGPSLVSVAIDGGISSSPGLGGGITSVQSDQGISSGASSGSSIISGGS
jgi:hypothetical protein